MVRAAARRGQGWRRRGEHVQTRRDQLQAYRFVTARVQSALLHGEPDAPETPMRRIGVAMISGIMVAVLVTVAFGIFGLLRPGGRQGWKAPGTLVVEKETGTRYVYTAPDGALHPVLNYASARLILNTADIAVKYFSRRSLADAPRGLPRGIPGLPDSLPGPDGLVAGPWTVCSQAPPGPQSATPEQTGATMTVSVRYAPGGQHIDARHALLVRTGTGPFLLWNDHALRVTSSTALDALHYNRDLALQVADTWVNSVPPGPDLQAIRVPGIGAPAPAVGGSAATVGTVYRVAGSASVPTQYWVMLADGLALITETDAYLLLGDDAIKQAYGDRTPAFIDISSADVSAVRSPTGGAATGGFPNTVPAQLDPAGSGSQVVCAAYSGSAAASTQVTVALTDRVPGARAQAGLPLGLAGQTASQVVLPPGTAAVVRALPRDGQPTDAYFIVTDTGGKYPVPSTQVLALLGYGGVSAVPVPTGILGLIPTGPALDPATANQESAVGANTVNLPIGQGGGG
jgi:type VII secretion protein EccB